MADKPLAIEEILSRLLDGPQRITRLTEGLTEPQLRGVPATDEWSAVEVLAHLRACADVWGDCITTILAEDRPTIRAVNPRTWVERTDYREQAFGPSLDAFSRQRAELLHVLEELAPADWERAALVTGAGRPLTKTAHSYAQRLARHEPPHVRQIGRVADTMRHRNSPAHTDDYVERDAFLEEGYRRE